MPLKQERRIKDVPAEIYVSLVDSLYREAPTLFIGALAAAGGVLLTAWTTGSPYLYACATLVVLIGLLRLIDMRRYGEQHDALSAASARRWELRYIVGSSAIILTLGVWCIISFWYLRDPFAEAISYGATIAYMIGISGRNFGSRRIVNIQIACAAIPIAIAFFSRGTLPFALAAMLMIGFFVTVKLISDRLRSNYLEAVIATRDITQLATRFDTALNNMPHGLAMFNADNRLVVANKRLVQMLGLPKDVADGQTTVRGLILASVRAGVLLHTDVKRFTDEIDAHFSAHSPAEVTIGLHDGRSLVITMQPMGGGGSVVVIEDVTERKQQEAKIAHMARFDSLTGLPNRTFFRDQMERSLALAKRGGPCAVLFIDLDQFKQVNDTLGHPAGDALLRAVADRLRRMVRDSDIVARFGGDEFVVLQSPIRSPDEAASLARRIVDAIGEVFSIDDQQIIIGASVGIALSPNDGQDADLLLKNADMALYRAKSDGRAGWRFFEPEMDVKAQARRALELDLRTALATDAFEVHYQPLINLKTMRISTCEALIRWPHPSRGMVPPIEFISIAEENGMIIEIGNRVLRKACAEAMNWPDDVRVAVNLSAVQVRRGGVPSAVLEALEGTGLPANRLEIEITESVLLEDTETTRTCMQALREIGVRISLDDFGTGYSSLSYLHSYPLHKVKIDRGFVQDIESSERSLTLLHSVARLSAELGLEVAIEGVESESQLALIRREPSVSEVQGYLFSPPVAKRDIRRLLAARTSLLERVA